MKQIRSSIRTRLFRFAHVSLLALSACDASSSATEPEQADHGRPFNPEDRGLTLDLGPLGDMDVNPGDEGVSAWDQGVIEDMSSELDQGEVAPCGGAEAHAQVSRRLSSRSSVQLRAHSSRAAVAPLSRRRSL